MKIKEWTLGQSDLETLDQQKERLTKERDRCRQSGDVAEGIVFKESLAGASGMSFMLMPEPQHSSEDIQRAADYLCQQRDVVDVYFVRIEPEATPASTNHHCTLGVRTGQLAREAGVRLPLQVLSSHKGFYLGTATESGRFSRESIEYWPSKDAADRALEGLEGKDWTQRTEV